MDSRSPGVVDFPTLFVALEWQQAHCVVPDGFRRGDPFVPVDWQAWCTLNRYRVKPTAKLGQLAPAFEYRRTQIVLPQKAGKAPHTAATICLEGVGPALFGGWALGGERWDCRDHGCGCGWIYEYEPGEAMGMAWPTPLIQITATSEDQTDNIYDALRPMIEDGPLSALIPKTGEEFIRLPGRGEIAVVTSNARSRLGQRLTFAPQDETGIWIPSSGMDKVAKVQRRGLSAMGGRAEETTNAWDPAEGSVAQTTAEAQAADIFRYHPLPPEQLKYRLKKDRRPIHAAVYEGCEWVDLDAINAEADEMCEQDPGEAERFFGNRVVAGQDRAFDLPAYEALADVDQTIARDRLVTLGFDGSLTQDATGLVATDVETGHQVVVDFWERPAELDEDAEWQVPIEELNEAVEFAFTHWSVWRMNADPPHYRNDLNRWAGLYGADKVVEWWTNNRRQMGQALKTWKTDMRAGVQSHGPLDDSEDAQEAHAALMRHVGNSIKRRTRMRDEEDGKFLWIIGKTGAKSKHKIDLAVAACLSWEARGAAIRAGALQKKTYGRASW